MCCRTTTTACGWAAPPSRRAGRLEGAAAAAAPAPPQPKAALAPRLAAPGAAAGRGAAQRQAAGRGTLKIMSTPRRCSAGVCPAAAVRGLMTSSGPTSPARWGHRDGPLAFSACAGFEGCKRQADCALDARRVGCGPGRMWGVPLPCLPCLPLPAVGLFLPAPLAQAGACKRASPPPVCPSVLESLPLPR